MFKMSVTNWKGSIGLFVLLGLLRLAPGTERNNMEMQHHDYIVTRKMDYCFLIIW